MSSASSGQKEKLPRGVGRVPAWWMELTPHYVLDLEEDENRRQQEEQEALYYAQMAAADDARSSGEWKSNWGGRSANGGENGSGGGSGLFGGRNFQPGSDGWDPKQWGVEANDPDYQSYLKGAKLPQSYIDAMKEFAGQAGIRYDASSLRSTGMYGRQAEKPAFTPAWAKKKLRSTGQGQAIRHGIYRDSPNKHLAHVGTTTDEVDQRPLPPAPTPVAPAPPAVAATPPVADSTPSPRTPTPAVVHHPIEHTYAAAPIRSNTPAAAPVENEAPEEKQKKYQFSDYYYNASSTSSPFVKASTSAAPEQAPKPTAPAIVEAEPEPEPEVAGIEQEGAEEEEEYEEVVEYVEEYEDGEEGEMYEEYVEEYEEEDPSPAPVVPQSANLTDLQALLAQKQAELARLQGM